MIATYNLLYVDDVPRSRDFYRVIFDSEPVQDQQTFALFVQPNGLKFGLWKREDVKPPAEPSARSSGFELGLPVENAEDVDAIADLWRNKGIELLQEPTDMDFGRTFTAADPDGHRLRVFAPAGS